MEAAGIVIWFTGLPASGKTTLAVRVRERLLPRRAILLDSDDVRATLELDAYAPGDRDRFYQLLGRLAGLLARQGQIVLVAATAPRRHHREDARAAAPRFIEVWMTTPLEICEERDPKGLYRRARVGNAPELPGVGVPYEVPLAAEVVVDPADTTAVEKVASAVDVRA